MAKTHRGPARTSRPIPKTHPAKKTAKKTTQRPTNKQVPTKWRRRHPIAAALVPVVVVVAAIATMVVIKATGGPATASGPTTGATTASGGDGTTALGAGVLASVTSVNPATLNTVGSPGGVLSPTKVSGHVALLARQRRQTRHHLHWLGVLPVLRGRTVGHGGCAVALRYL